MSDPAPLSYRVTPLRPEAHLFAVELLIPEPAAASLTLALPAWIPGSYMIRDFARNIVSLAAEQAAAGPLSVTKLDKQTWRLDGIDSDGAVVTVRWEVYAWELTVRSAHLDRTHGYFNGTSLFLRVAGREDRPCRVELLPPPDPDLADWRLATSLRRDGAEPWGFGTYRADDYEDLIDHPVEMGRFALVEYEVQGVPHAMALTGRQHADLDRLSADLAPICAEHAAMFGELPIDRYLFLTMTVGSGYGGLEHRFSSSLLCSRKELPASGSKDVPAPPDKDYRRFLGLCSHEYFHLWNVKRIRPRVFVENGLDREVHTRLLWAFEGITSYYDDLALVRSGRIDAKGCLELLAETITRVYRNPGRLAQTLAESSFDAWTKFYKQDENAPNAIVSYYAKGALAALALDLTIRRDTEGRCSLDDVMRALWQRHGRTGEGVEERGVEAVAAEVTGLDLDGFFDHALDATEDLDLVPLFATVGVDMRWRPASGATDNGGVVDSFGDVEPRPDIGIRLQSDARDAMLAVVLDRRPAQRAGLAPGDQIIAVDGIKADAAGLEALLGRTIIGEPVIIHAFRRDELMTFDVIPEPAPADTCELRLLDAASGADDAALARRSAWLASSVR
jgi:predicted metalloprotease with PDZ domain